MRCYECYINIRRPYYYDNVSYCISCFEDLLTEDFLNFHNDPISVTEIE